MTPTSDRASGEAFQAVPPRLLALAAVAWFLLALMLAVLGNTDRRPLDEHEVYVARTAVEMSRRGDWVVPYFGGTPRLQKPPLNYWLAAGAALLCGENPAENVSAFAARLPSALSGWLLVLLTAALTLQLTHSPNAALLAAAAVTTSNGLVSWSHNARPEMVYATLCTASLLCFVIAAKRPDETNNSGGRTRIIWSLLGWGFLGFATLAKGPHYPLFLVLALGVAGWYRWRDFRRVRMLLCPALGCLLAAAIVVAYVLPLSVRVPNLFGFWYRELFYRTGGAEGILYLFRFYYFWALVQLTAPWSIVVVLAFVWAVRRLRQLPVGVCICWFAVVVPALILGCSRGQRAYYLLPSLGAAFSLTGYALHSVVLSGRWLMGRPLPLDRVIRLHVALVGVLAGVVLFRAWQFAQIGIVDSTAVIAVVVGVISGAVGLGIAYVRAALPRPLVPLGGLFAGTAAVLATGVACGLLWSPDRYIVVSELRRLAEKLPRGIPVYALSGRIEHLIYYGDRPLRRITHTEAAQILRERRHVLLIFDGDCARCRTLTNTVSKATAVRIGKDRLVLAHIGCEEQSDGPLVRIRGESGGHPPLPGPSIAQRRPIHPL